MANFWAQDVDIRLAATDTLPPGQQPVMLRCPMRENHNDSKKSLAVFPANVHCFGCPFHIVRRYESLAFLLGYWDGRGTCPSAAIGRVRSEAYKYTHDRLEVYRERVTKSASEAPINPAVARGLYVNLVANRDKLNYLRYDRGLSDDIIARAGLGYDGGRYSIPIFSTTGAVLNIRYRRDNSKAVFDWRGEEVPKYEGTMGHNGLFLYPLPILLHGQMEWGIKELYVVEGEYDALRLWSIGVPAVSPTNGAGQVKKVPALLHELGWMNSVKKLVILTDMDAPGWEAAYETAEAGVALGYECVRGSWPLDAGKDITEYLMTHTMEDIQYEPIGIETNRGTS